MYKIIAIVFSAILVNNSLQSQITLGNGNLSDYLNTVTTAVPFLRITPDARSAGMGDVGIATTPDVNSIYWNTSKLGFINDDHPSAVSVNYVHFQSGLNSNPFLASVYGYQKLNDKNVVTLSARYFSLGKVALTGTGTLNDFHTREFAFDVGCARKVFENISVGLNLKYLYTNIPEAYAASGVQIKPAQGIASDISLFNTTKFEIFNKDSELGIGINVSNIGNKIIYTSSIEKDYLPTNLAIGTSYQVNLNEFNKLSFAIDLNKLMVPTPDTSDIEPQNGIPDFREQTVLSGIFNSFSDAPDGFTEEIHEVTISTGLEYWFDNKLAIRTGYFYEHATKGGRQFYTVGGGIHYNTFGLDFAYLLPSQGNQNPLDPVARISLNLNLHELHKTKHDDGNS